MLRLNVWPPQDALNSHQRRDKYPAAGRAQQKNAYSCFSRNWSILWFNQQRNGTSCCSYQLVSCLRKIKTLPIGSVFFMLKINFPFAFAKITSWVLTQINYCKRAYLSCSSLKNDIDFPVPIGKQFIGVGHRTKTSCLCCAMKKSLRNI